MKKDLKSFEFRYTPRSNFFELGQRLVDIRTVLANRDGLAQRPSLSSYLAEPHIWHFDDEISVEKLR